ncbi:MAG: ribonucleoside-diphosphate reductase subunit alpha, partial [Stenotrophomonas sp.]
MPTTCVPAPWHFTRSPRAPVSRAGPPWHRAPTRARAWSSTTMTDSTFRVADLAGAGDAMRASGERVPTWITKEAGNRRLPYDAARLLRSIDAIHAELPQLDVADYRRVVLAMVERKP